MKKMSFIPDKELISAVEQKEKTEAQKRIRAYTHSDPYNERNDTFQAVTYAMDRGLDVFDDNDESIEIHTDKSVWTEDYLDSVTTGLVRNFSKARLEHWAQVATYVGKAHLREKKNNSKITGQLKNVESPQESTKKGWIIAGIVGLIALILFLISR